MAKIYIDTQRIKPCIARTGDLAQALKELAQETDNVRANLRHKIAGRAAIEASLRTVSDRILREEVSVRSMRDTLEQIAGCYERTEHDNLERVTSEDVQGRDSTSGGITLPDWVRYLQNRYGSWISNLIPPKISFITSLVNILLSDLQVSGSHGFNRTDAKVKRGGGAEWEPDDLQPSDINPESKTFGKYFYHPDTGTLTKVDEDDPDAMQEFKEHNDKNRGIPVDVKLLSVGAENSLSLYGGEGKISNRYGGVEGSYDLDKFETNAGLYIGLTGVGAEIGGSVTAFTAEGKSYLGNEDTQTYVKGKVTAGKIGGKANVQAGLHDKDGDFNPSLYAGASVEAIAGEISGSVGGKAFGTEVELEGSLNYGVGAHANIGMHDGKISMDIGATLGVGGSVKLEIDVSGALDAMHDKAGEIWSGVKNLFRW